MYKRLEKFVLWQKAHGLVKDVYGVTQDFPRIEIYGLISQMRRSAVSIPSNILEGKARDSTKEYLRFLKIARGSLEELRYQLFLSHELEYIIKEDYVNIESKSEEVSRLLHGLIKSLRT